MRAVIGRRPVAMLTLVRLPMFRGVGIRVALPNDCTRVAMCHGDASERAMQTRVRLQGKRRLGRRENRRAKKDKGEEAAEHVKSKVRVVRLSKNERGTAVLVVLSCHKASIPTLGALSATIVMHGRHQFLRFPGTRCSIPCRTSAVTCASATA